MLRARLEQQGYGPEWTVSSAGTWAQVKRGASQYSLEVAAERGLDISSHVAEMIDAPHLAQADLVLCMESGHAEALRAEFPAYAHKVHMISQMVEKVYSVSDPYGKPREAYQMMATELERIIDEGFTRIVTLAANHDGERP